MNDYSKGEQILTFLTMELFSLCLLTWKPISALLISGTSYLYFYDRISQMVAVNTGEVGTTDATRINFFIMWLSTMMVCIANYNNTRAQAIKDENLEQINTYLSKISVEDKLTGIHNMVYFRNEAEKLLNYVTTDRDSIIFLFFDVENFKSYNEKYGFHAGNELLIKLALKHIFCLKSWAKIQLFCFKSGAKRIFFVLNHGQNTSIFVSNQGQRREKWEMDYLPFTTLLLSGMWRCRRCGALYVSL